MDTIKFIHDFTEQYMLHDDTTPATCKVLGAVVREAMKEHCPELVEQYRAEAKERFLKIIAELLEDA